VTTPEESSPNWAFSPDHEIKCPECGATLAGLNWVLTDEDVLTAMALVPCGHQLPTDLWELSFSGRDRKLGTVIRTPKFQRKDGS
jgi:hypothetical protein